MKDIKANKLLAAGIILLLSFFIFTILVSFNILNGVDRLVTNKLQLIFPRIVDLPFSLFSLFGSAEIVFLILLILRYLFKQLNIISILIGFVIFHAIELIGKAFVTHLGPPKELVRYFFQFSFPSSSVKPGFSFPSGHVGRTMFLSVLLIYLIWSVGKLSARNKKLLIFLIVLFDTLMLISRVYLGEHWFSDVVGGALLGSSMALLSLTF